jgi:FKBP-type peptidyl-prolyl cis-trans isomerase
MPRRILASAAVLAASLALIGAGSPAGASTVQTTAQTAALAGPAGNPDALVTVSGAFGKEPTVRIPARAAGGSLAVRTVIKGDGPAITRSDAFVGYYVVYTWDGSHHKLLDNAFGNVPTLFTEPLLPGVRKAMTGRKSGSRVLVIVPPADAWGSAGNPGAGVTGSDTLVFVIDVTGVIRDNASASGPQVSAGPGLPGVSDTTGAAPKVTIPANPPPGTLTTRTLIKGRGPVLRPGEFVVTQYTGVIWRTGKVFDSTWSREAPFGFQLDATPEQVIKGWDLGLTGQRVGSRVLLVIPPADGYGSTGAPGAGITGTDTIVFVVDIIDAYNNSAGS